MSGRQFGGGGAVPATAESGSVARQWSDGIGARLSGGGLPSVITVSAGFVWTQATALAAWTVPHNLGKRCAVTVVDNLDRVIEPDVQYIDDYMVQVTHAMPLVGKVYCN